MKLFNLFRKESTNIKEENKDDLKFFYKHLSEKYSITEAEASLLITQALFAYHPFDIYKVRDLELNLTKENLEDYNQEKINLDKIHRLFLFFATTRTHELKNKYQEWMKDTMINIKSLFLEQEKEAESFLMHISLSSYMKKY